MTEIPSIFTFPVSCPKCTDGSISMVVETEGDKWILRFECQKCGRVAKSTVDKWFPPKEPHEKEIKPSRVAIDTIRNARFYDEVVKNSGYTGKVPGRKLK